MEEAKMKIGSIVVRCYEFDKMVAFSDFPPPC